MMVRTVVSWLVVLLGILLGMLVIAIVGGPFDGVHALVAVLVGVAAGCVPVLASLIALTNPRRAARIYLCVAPITPLLFPPLSWELGFWEPGSAAIVLSAIVLLLGVLVVPGLFWLLTARRNWPPLFQLPHSFQRSRLPVILGTGLLCVFVVVALLSSLFLPWWPLIGDCHSGPLLTEQGIPESMDFTARIVFVAPVSFHGLSLWSIAQVEERFADVPSWPHNLLILRGYFLPTDRFKRYLVEGKRSKGAIARVLPVVEPVECGHTAHLENSTVALRVLHDGPPRSGIRVLGVVYRSLQTREPASGVKVRITGPSGVGISMTNAQGVYDVTGLPPGHYTIELAEPDWHTVNIYDLDDRAIREDAFYLRHLLLYSQSPPDPATLK